MCYVSEDLVLREYQHPVVDYMMENLRCNVFMPMGMGKTPSTLTAIGLLSLTEVIYPVLILGPLRVVNSTWPDEIAKWTQFEHLSVSIVTGTPAERRAALAVKADVYCTNFDNLVWLDEYLGDKWPFRMVVADECSKLKGYRTMQGAKRAHALATHVHTKSPRYVGLTGTPAANGLSGLWGIMWFVDSGRRLGKSFKAFSERWFRVGYDGFKLEPLAHSQVEIQGLIADRCLSLNAADYFDLLEPLVTMVRVTMPPAARRHYDEMEDDMFTTLAAQIKGQTVDVEAFSAGGKMMNCRQLANGALYTDDHKTFSVTYDGKIEALQSIVEESMGSPLLVAYHFKSDLARLKKAFPKARVLDKKPQTIKDFNAGKIEVLFAHAASAGHGLNLAQGGHSIVYFSFDWNLEEHLQILERIGPVRQAQINSGKVVQVYYIVATNTVDELLIDRLEGKKTVQQVLMDALKFRKAGHK